jgi:hypothetical protein
MSTIVENCVLVIYAGVVLNIAGLMVRCAGANPGLVLWPLFLVVGLGLALTGTQP